jgi:hypothetical protein
MNDLEPVRGALCLEDDLQLLLEGSDVLHPVVVLQEARVRDEFRASDGFAERANRSSYASSRQSTAQDEHRTVTSRSDGWELSGHQWGVSRGRGQMAISDAPGSFAGGQRLHDAVLQEREGRIEHRDIDMAPLPVLSRA